VPIRSLTRWIDIDGWDVTGFFAFLFEFYETAGQMPQTAGIVCISLRND
jgi:hypothetical protein